MDLLEDADGMVRDLAKATVIELFKNAPNGAKSDLKRQLKNFKVRPAIEQAIVKSLTPSTSRPGTPADAPPARSTLAVSTSSAVERPVTPAAEPPRADSVEPQYVNTHRELDDIFKEMAWWFEGKETEQNWSKREESVGTLRRLNAGNAPSDFLDTFVPGLRAMLDGIIKAVTSLRTSLSKEGCSLVQDLAMTLGPAMDPLVELLMQTLIKLCAATKKIASQQACQTVDIIISNVSYNQRLMQHVWAACQDKNVQPRTYVTGWLKTILKKEAGHRAQMEHSGGVDLMEKCIKKCLGDPNPAVREKMRSTFWVYHSVWPARADAIKDNLDATAQKLLNKDPGNPDAASSGASTAARPGSSLSKSTASRPGLREAVSAQKRAMMDAKKKLPARPGSAMAQISPAVSKTSDSKTNDTATTSAATKPSARARPESGTVSVNAGGMSMAPVRPARRRPEMAPRPATAGPYSVRDQPSSMEADSPSNFVRPSKAAVPKQPASKDTTPKRTAAPRTRPGHQSHASESSIPSPSTARFRAAAAASGVSPRGSPAKLKTVQSAPVPRSPARAEQKQLQEEAVEPLEPPMSPPVAEPASQEEGKQEQQPPVQPGRETTPVVAVLELEPDFKPQPPAGPPLKVYEDPFVGEPTTPKPTFTGPVLEDKPVNEDAAILQQQQQQQQNATLAEPGAAMESPEKTKQNLRLVDSGLAKIEARSLEVHGFRRMQSLLRDSKMVLGNAKMERLLMGLFRYLEDPMEGTASDKSQDVKAQILTTIKLLLTRDPESFRPHVSDCLVSLVRTRSAYDGRSHIVSGLEVLSAELASLGDACEIVVVLCSKLAGYSDSSPEGCRALSMGLLIIKSLLDKASATAPSTLPLNEGDLSALSTLTTRCLDSADSRVRMDAVQLCVALHTCVGEARFWDALSSVKDDPKSLITYYIVKKQREQQK
ncbi:CLIP-associating protein 1/2 [Geosmithia morbida]|uniref:CLIP-associating protein 1/2 n=1 Tax=Geosmithia morbida TaxID=1094350 RepID=A0A9P4Z1T4_9HYPO|nr:CLIP-associating protein 1/2 [Geosmithia morbida]KAF4126582.1 CLIP-associating protein 1/2 [Geosmithia morbida]